MIPYVLIFYLAWVATELLAILSLFTFKKLQNIHGTKAGTWQQKLAADIPSL